MEGAKNISTILNVCQKGEENGADTDTKHD